MEVVDVLGYVFGFVDALLAEGLTVAISIARIGAPGAVSGVAGEGLHHIPLVVKGLALVGPLPPFLRSLQSGLT
jgi:hypothetical protein